ncbi:MAG: hypothetical protein ACI4A3_00690 [Lachnospiraceae bacterium]
MYDDIYELCRNTERVMGMFSKELQILDENTVQYMMDEMQETIDSQKGTIGKQKQDLAEKDQLIRKLQQQLETVRS